MSGDHRAAWAALLVVAGMGLGCQEGPESPTSPPAPTVPAAEIPPPPPRKDTLFLGFAQDRIEIVEGEPAAVDIFFEQYNVDDDPETWVTTGLAEVQAVVEPGTASEADLLLRGVLIGTGGQILAPGTTWLAMLAVEDDLDEGPETLTLRLDPLPDDRRWSGVHPEVIEITRGELEVVIRDAPDAGTCRNVTISATPPRDVGGAPRGSAPSCEERLWETEVTVESDRGDAIQLDRIRAPGRVYGWRVESLGERVRHQLRFQWVRGPDLPLEMALRPCAETGRGPTLVCGARACRTYPPGATMPPPERQAQCRQEELR